jgi:transposase
MRNGTRLEPLIPKASPGGRPRKANMRATMNAILYLLRTGCPWRCLPRDSFPPRSTVYNIFRKFQRGGTWEAIWTELHMASRGWAGRPALLKAERSTSYSIAKGCRCGPSSTPPQSRTRWGRTRPRQNTPSLPVARTDLGRRRLKPWQVERSRDRSGFVVLPRRWGLSAPSPGSSGTGVSPRTPRTLPKLWAPSLPSHIQLALRRLARA